MSLSICNELDEENLHILSIVSRDFNNLTSDNNIWSQLALRRWEHKQGIKEICEENRIFWFKKPGTWKIVYNIVEREAQRTLLDVNDLVENSWICTVSQLSQLNETIKLYARQKKAMPNQNYLKNIDNRLARNQLVTFSPDGTYTHNHEVFSRSWPFPWSIAGDGSVSLNHQPFTPSRSPDWKLIISNGILAFTSPGNGSFRRKLKEFNSELITEFRQDHLR
ncbi:33608_t:CDS:2 [Racocetra persica]|uniref:33608_t:CDS:1 n=1 Tax=Racocetra persica TaxID=160502 RepID=A0ACA9QYX9_9GLOM|nr:33608_t:CDS:2 [Racocetra persica]